MSFNEHLASRIQALLEGHPSLSEKKMFGGVAFMIGGNMAVGVTNKGDLMVRVGPDAYEEALSEPNARPMDFTGRPMKGLVLVGPGGLDTETELAGWVERGVSFAESLPDK